MSISISVAGAVTHCFSRCNGNAAPRSLARAVIASWQLASCWLQRIACGALSVRLCSLQRCRSLGRAPCRLCALPARLCAGGRSKRVLTIRLRCDDARWHDSGMNCAPKANRCNGTRSVNAEFAGASSYWRAMSGLDGRPLRVGRLLRIARRGGTDHPRSRRCRWGSSDDVWSLGLRFVTSCRSLPQPLRIAGEFPGARLAATE